MSLPNHELLDALRKSFPQLFSRRTEDGQTTERLDLEKVHLLARDGNCTDKYGLRWDNKPEKFDVEAAGKLPTLKRVLSKRVVGGLGLQRFMS